MILISSKEAGFLGWCIHSQLTFLSAGESRQPLQRLASLNKRASDVEF
jgi:hypothetical protein